MKIEIRAGAVRIDGYVNAVGRLSRMLKDDYGTPYREMIEPGAFAKALQTAGTVPALLDHDSSRKLADTSSGLELKEDSIGLYADMVSADPELIQLAKDGKLRGWSFGFTPLDSREEYTSTGDHNVIITELDLREVSVIDDRMLPVYAGTSINAKARAEPEDEKQILYRAMDDDIVCRMREAPDYSKYNEVIRRLSRTGSGRA